MQQISAALKIPAEAIKNFDEEQVINIISNNTFDNCAQPIAGTAHYHDCTFNPLDKLMEALEENKKLYERLLQAEREKVALLEKLLERK
ncbi:hypothetical protein D9M69_724730 [compost metagenome]